MQHYIYKSKKDLNLQPYTPGITPTGPHAAKPLYKYVI